MLAAALAVGASSAQAPVPPPAQPPAAGARAGGGRGGPGATLYTEHCVSCHGTDLAGGRYDSLFDQTWLARITDERMMSSIRNGVPNTEMEGFKQALTELQVWQLIQYIRTQGGSLAPKPQFVADPNGHVIKTETLSLSAEVVARGLETPWALAFLPDGRLLITERAGRLRILDNGKLSEPVKGTPTVHEQQDGGMFDVEIHPQYAKNGWVYLAYSEVRPGFVPPPPAAAPGSGRCRARPWPRSVDSVDDRRGARQDQSRQRVDGSAGHLPRACRPVHAERFTLRLPADLRQGGSSLLYAR